MSGIQSKPAEEIQELFKSWMTLITSTIPEDLQSEQKALLYQFATHIYETSHPTDELQCTNDILAAFSTPIWWGTLEGKPVPESRSRRFKPFKYAIEQPLGGGGFGEVYLAKDLVLNRNVALKILSPEASRDKKITEAFIREILQASSLEHANITRIYELGFHDGQHFATMEYVEGQDLREAVISVRQFNLTVLRGLLIQICKALAYIHKKGFIHCDLKPENILIDTEGNTKITDFSLMRHVSENFISSEDAFWGTPTYLSPEMIEGKQFDHRADIYSLGVIFYEMRTGIPPFDGSANEILHHHLLTIPRLPSRRAPNIFPEEDRIIMKCLAKNPDERYADANELLADIMRLDISERIAEISSRGPCSIPANKFCDKPVETDRTLIPLINASGFMSNATFEENASEIIRDLGFSPVRMGQSIENMEDLCKSCQLSSAARTVIANLGNLSITGSMQLGMAFGNEKRVLLLNGTDAPKTFFSGIFPVKQFMGKRELTQTIRQFIKTHDSEIANYACFFRWEFHCRTRPVPTNEKRIFLAVQPQDNKEKMLLANAVRPGLSQMGFEPITLNTPDFNSMQSVYDAFCSICRGVVTSDAAIIDVSQWNTFTAFVAGILIGAKKRIIFVQRSDSAPPGALSVFEFVKLNFFKDIIDAVHDHLL